MMLVVPCVVTRTKSSFLSNERDSLQFHSSSFLTFREFVLMREATRPLALWQLLFQRTASFPVAPDGVPARVPALPGPLD
jgi:hypothetical protein